jgi:hypothetical protein
VKAVFATLLKPVRFLNEIAISGMLGSLLKRVEREYLRAGYPASEVERLAKLEVFTALRESIIINPNSYLEMRTWVKDYPVEGKRPTYQTTGGSKVRKVR